jgi:hypothetical protein
MNLETLIIVGGILHFGTLLAGYQMTQVLDWKSTLKQLEPLSRHVIWVHGVFVSLTIFAFGLISVLFANDIVAGGTLARGVCAFIALFWGIRLFIQFTLFDAKPYLKSNYLKLGYHGLTCVFTYHTIIYTLIAVRA